MEAALLIGLILCSLISVSFSIVKVGPRRVVVRMSSSVLIVGLNPALQRRVRFSKLQKGSVNRASDVGVGIGGKGQDVLVASMFMNKKSSARVDISQFIGSGGEGDTLLGLLRDIRASESLTVRSKEGLRICTTLIDESVNNETTELVEPSGTISESEANAMLQKVKDQYDSGSASGIAVMGSMPPGLKKDYYCSLLDIAAGEGCKVCLDTNIRIVDTVKAVQLRGAEIMVKLNARELTALMDVAGAEGGEAESATSMDAIQTAADKLATSVGGDSSRVPFYIGVTDGPYTSYLIKSSRGVVSSIHEFKMPQLPRPLVNAIGAGDAVASGTILRWTDSMEFPIGSEETDISAVDAFRFGLSVGCASCMTTENSVFALEDAMTIYGGIIVDRVR